jgi:hypothetical protein
VVIYRITDRISGSRFLVEAEVWERFVAWRTELDRRLAR